MTEYPIPLTEIVSWFRSKQRSLAGLGISLVDIRERTEHLPAAAADFEGGNAQGRINAWISGEFDFEALRISDGKDIFWRNVKVSALGDELENAYTEFLRNLQNPGTSGQPAQT